MADGEVVGGGTVIDQLSNRSPATGCACGADDMGLPG
ncbi:hypothetical protein ES703_61521 [subsurface metagenome]